MHSNGPVGRVTRSPRLLAADEGLENRPAAPRERRERDRDDARLDVQELPGQPEKLVLDFGQALVHDGGAPFERDSAAVGTVGTVEGTFGTEERDARDEARDDREDDRDHSEDAHGARVYARNGDVDKDGEVVDALERRLREAIVPSGSVDADAHLAAVRTVVTSARARPARWAP
jgi:hypothetical protein